MTSPAPMATTTTLSDEELRDRLREDGFVVIRQMVTAEQLSELRDAAARTRDRAVAGQWPHIRTVGKQFPPWPSTPGPEGIWGVQGLLHPDLGADAATFARRHYFDARLLGAARALLGCGDADLVLELLNLLVRPSGGRAFALRWHRDDVPADAAPAAEAARLAAPAWHAQWNLALHADDSLVVVPGSHARPRTPAERAADPFAAHLPGQAVVRLAPGDCVFYNNNILHRGVYDAARERLSLHGSVGHRLGGPLRARNVLQHGVGAWVDRCDFSVLDAPQRAQAEGMRARLLALGRASGDVGYSHEG